MNQASSRPSVQMALFLRDVEVDLMYGRGNKTRSSYLGITLHGSGNEEKTNSYPGIGIALGVALGTAFGVVLDKLALGIGFGIALGAAIALALSSRQSGKTGEPGRDAGSNGDSNGDGA